MTKENNVAGSYQANKVPFTYELAPRLGNYKIIAVYWTQFFNQPNLMAEALWKKPGATKDTIAEKVDVHLEILRCNTANGPKEKLNSEDLIGNVIRVTHAEVKTNLDDVMQFHIQWEFHKLERQLSTKDARVLANSNVTSDAIDQFIKNEENKALFSDDEFEDFEDDFIEDDLD